MGRGVTIYDVCDDAILREGCDTEPGLSLRRQYVNIVHQVLLRFVVLRDCQHSAIDAEQLSRLKEMMRAAMRATPKAWGDPAWIDQTFRPLAELLDRTKKAPAWQVRHPASERRDGSGRGTGSGGRSGATAIGRGELARVMHRCLDDVFRVWGRDAEDPWLPVAAQVVLTGDDHLDGERLLDILRGLGSFELQSITVLFSLVRCFLLETPRRRDLIRRPYEGVSEPMTKRFSWIWHRIAFSDVTFFEHLVVYLEVLQPGSEERLKLLGILENLVRYCVVTSQEWLTTPDGQRRYPAITCLPKDDRGEPLCRLTRRAWEKKRDLGFGDYVPDTDTTFLVLGMARRWSDLAPRERARRGGFTPDADLLAACASLLDHPWIGIIHAYQVGNPMNRNPPSIHLTRPLEYEGAVPIWFDKPFVKNDGRVVREALGNEICPGHNMDILEAILVNRAQWHALEGKHLDFLHRLLDFHHRAFSSGNFRLESSLKYYLPEMYVFYLGRMYQTFQGLTQAERATLDPAGKVEDMRRRALDYLEGELMASTTNAFDAALGVSALCLLGAARGGPHVRTLERGLNVLVSALGEGPRGHPYRAYEWNRMRHPTRILVGSEVSTSLFVLRACVEAWRALWPPGSESEDIAR